MNMTATESRTANAASGAALLAKNSLNASNEFSNLLYSPKMRGSNPASANARRYPCSFNSFIA